MFYYENWKKRAWKINVKKIGMKGFEKEVKRKEDHRGWNDAVLPKTYFRINQDLDNRNSFIDDVTDENERNGTKSDGPD